MPLFLLAARLRSEPELLGEPVAIVEGEGSRAWVNAASRRARKLGVRAGMTLPQARGILPRLIARGRDLECERAAQEALLDAANRISPRVEDAEQGVVYLDATGLERHYGTENAELDLATAAIEEARRAGLVARAGLAASKLAARVAAELPETPTIVPPGDELRFLAPLPLERLHPEMKIAASLERWGLRSIGELARIPEGEISARLGDAGRLIHAAARGIDARPLIPRVPPPDFREGLALEWPLVTLEPFVFVANAALERLCTRMRAHGYGCQKIELSLQLEPDGHHDRSIDLPSVTSDPKTLLTLIRLDLEQNPPGAPVSGFTLVAHPDRPRKAQLSLFGPLAMSPDKLATTIARLASIVGADRVGAAEPVDSRRPEAVNVVPFDPPPPPSMTRSAGSNRGLLSVRVLRPPIEIEVILEHEGGGKEEEAKPRRVRSLQPKRFSLDGMVRVASGPWTIEEAWWTEQPVERLYWDVELARGGIYRIYRDKGLDRWFTDGVYD